MPFRVESRVLTQNGIEPFLGASVKLLAAKRGLIGHSLVKLAKMLAVASRRLSGQGSWLHATARNCQALGKERTPAFVPGRSTM